MSVFQQFRLDGRIALVTGAGRGIGLAIAQALAEAGAKVAIQDIDLAVAEAEVKKITDAGGQGVALGGDASKLDDVEAWVPKVTEALGPIDVLVNNAAIQDNMKFVEWPADEIESVLRANITAPIRLCQQVVPHMKQQKWGRILNIGSIQGLKGSLSMSPYAASKAAIHNLTISLARGLGEHGITCNALAPGVFDTLRNKEFFAHNEANNLKWLPLRRAGEPDDCAAIALLLCSDAGRYITGDVVSVDGGMAI